MKAQLQPPSRGAWPTLKEIASSQQSGSKVGKRLEIMVRTALKEPSTDFEVLVRAIRACTDIREHEQLLESSDPMSLEHDDLPDYATYAQRLFRVLENYSTCTCSQNDKDGAHWARLRLRPVYEMADNSVPFDMVFSAEPNPVRVFDWQEAQVLIPTKTKRKGVSFGQNKEPQAQTEFSDGDSDSEEIDSLCELVGGRCGAVLRLKANGDRLSNTPPSQLTKIDMPELPGTTLGELMQEFKFQSGMRPVLAYAVAKAVWHYYDSDWMTVAITSSRIFFMEEKHGESLAHFCKPYLSVGLKSGRESMHDWTSVLGTVHRWPRVLALSIMLIEIATGQPIGIEGSPEDWDSKLANDQLRKLKGLVETGESFQEDCNNPCYKEVVKKCLDPFIFKAVPFNAKRPTKNRDKRREVLYNEIVTPLRKFIRGAEWDKVFQDIETTPLKPKNSGTIFHSVKDSMPRPNAASSIGSPSKSESKDWLDEVAELNLRIQQARLGTGTKGQIVKIAILDTGFNASSFTGTSRRIKEWKDFVSNASDPVDEDGHGTHLLGLFFRMRCSAHIYVARVTKDNAGVSGAEDQVADAIRVAATKWNVDFVSLSLGFPRFPKKIKAAISAAQRHNENITFFAAANNEGLNRSEMYPAKLGEDRAVLPIRGTYSNGSFHPRFNPPPSSGSLVFGTLGYDVHSEWPGEKRTRGMSGCSVATPIAATLAVMMIDYASSKPNDFSPNDLSLMRSRRGVFEMFKGM